MKERGEEEGKIIKIKDEGEKEKNKMERKKYEGMQKKLEEGPS